DLRYGSGGYFWINDMQPRMIMHAVDRALDGADLSNYRDSDGLPLFRRMVEVCRTAGEGIVRYRWPRAGSDRPLNKISYVKRYPPWNWVIGSGIYVDDIQTELAVVQRVCFGLVFLVVGVGGPLSLWMFRGLGRPVEAVATGLGTVSSRISNASHSVLNASQSI